jgi:hypothetical protein
LQLSKSNLRNQKLKQRPSLNITTEWQFLDPFIKFMNAQSPMLFMSEWKAGAYLSGIVKKSGEHMFGEAEIRMGYNYFYNGRDHVTPFAGVGMLRDYTEVRHEEGVFFNGQFYKRHHHSEKMEAIGYGVIGFLFDHEFNRCVCLGSNFKFLVGGSFSDKHRSWGNPVVGVDIAIPLTFRFGYKRHWDLRVEPFDIYLNGRDISRNYIGFRSTVGYRF